MTDDTTWTLGLGKTAANHVPLTPLSFIARTAEIYPRRLALVHGALRQSWGETFARTRRLASALHRRGIGAGDVVAVLAPNTPAMYEAHFGVPMAGAVLNTLNTRLDAESLAFMLHHAGAKVLLVDREFSAVASKALALLAAPPFVVDIEDPPPPPPSRSAPPPTRRFSPRATPNSPGCRRPTSGTRFR